MIRSLTLLSLHSCARKCILTQRHFHQVDTHRQKVGTENRWNLDDCQALLSRHPSVAGELLALNGRHVDTEIAEIGFVLELFPTLYESNYSSQVVRFTQQIRFSKLPRKMYLLILPPPRPCLRRLVYRCRPLSSILKYLSRFFLSFLSSLL